MQVRGGAMTALVPFAQFRQVASGLQNSTNGTSADDEPSVTSKCPYMLW